MTIRHHNLSVAWLGYSTTRIEARDGPVVYTDPGRYGVLTGEWESETGAPHPPSVPYEARDGQVVVVTHDHHYDTDGIRRVADDDATVVVYEAVDATNIERDVEPVDALPYDVRRVGYGDAFSVAGVTIEVMPAYNTPTGASSERSVSHPEGFGCGYRLTITDTAVLWPGDTDALPLHRDLDASLFLPPIGSSFTMDRTEAAELARDIDPDLVLPIHYNTFESLEADSRAFAADVAQAGVPVVLDERGPNHG